MRDKDDPDEQPRRPHRGDDRNDRPTAGPGACQHERNGKSFTPAAAEAAR